MVQPCLFSLLSYVPVASPVPSVTLPEDNAAMCTFNVVNTLIILTLNIACVLYLYK